MPRVLIAVLAVVLALCSVACKHTDSATETAAPAAPPAAAAEPVAAESPEAPSDVVAVADEKRSIEGTAQNAKMGAVLVTDEGNVWVDLDAWPDDLIGKKLRVEGRMISKSDVPVVVMTPGEPVAAGVPLEAGQDPAQAAARQVLSHATWTLVE